MSEVSETTSSDDVKSYSQWRPKDKCRIGGVPLKACRNCGKVWKYEHNCPAEGKTCGACGKVGHFARFCLTSKNRRNDDSKQYTWANQRHRGFGGKKNQPEIPNEYYYNSTVGYSRKETTNKDTGHFRRNWDKKYQWRKKRENKENADEKSNNYRNFNQNSTKKAECGATKMSFKSNGTSLNSKNVNSVKKRGEEGSNSQFGSNVNNRSQYHNKNERRNNSRVENSADKNDADDSESEVSRQKKYKTDNDNFQQDDNSNKQSDTNNRNFASSEPGDVPSNAPESAGHKSNAFFDESKSLPRRNTRYAYTRTNESRYDPRPEKLQSANCDSQFTNNNNNNAKPRFNHSNKAHDDYNMIGLKRKLANSSYQRGNYEAALCHYSRLVELCPKDPVSFSNRCACYMMIGQYNNALLDALRAIELDPGCVKAHCRANKCALAVGDINTAENYLSKLSTIDPNSETIAVERRKLREWKYAVEMEKNAVESGNLNDALDMLNKRLLISTQCKALKIRKAEYLALLGRYSESEEIINQILIVDKNNLDIKFVLGIRLYYTNIDEAVCYFKDILRLDPDHTKTVKMLKKAKKIIQLKQAGNDAFYANNFTTAHDIYLSILAIDPSHIETKKKVYYNMGQASFKLGNFERAIEEYTKTINIDINHIKALKQRGHSYMKIKDYEEAIADFSRVCNLDPKSGCRTLIDEAEKLLSCIKKDHYQILGISRDASIEEVKRAYREKALLHHPDRHSHLTHEQQKKHERKFKAITVAYREITERMRKNFHFGA